MSSAARQRAFLILVCPWARSRLYETERQLHATTALVRDRAGKILINLLEQGFELHRIRSV